MKTRQLAKLVCTMLFGLTVGTVLAGTLAVPAVRHCGYINGTLNLALVASDEVRAAGATVEVQASADDDTWLRLRLVRDFDENGKTVFISYFRKDSSGDWTLFSKWTDTDGLFGKDAYICLGASRKPHASLSADTTRFLVREIKCKPLHMGMAVIVR